MLELGQREKRLLEIVEAELEKRRLFDDGAGFFEHLGGRGADDGNTDFTDTGTRNWGTTLGTFILMSTIAVYYIPARKDANFC